jgi:hypothetical protein
VIGHAGPGTARFRQVQQLGRELQATFGHAAPRPDEPDEPVAEAEAEVEDHDEEVVEQSSEPEEEEEPWGRGSSGAGRLAVGGVA